MRILKIRDVKTPTRGTSKSAGVDLYVPNGYPRTKIEPGQSVLIPSGVKVNVPENHVFIAMNKSGIATKKGLYVGACVIDEDYQGEVHIHLTNVGLEECYIEGGDKVVQCLLIPVNYENVEVASNEDELWDGLVTDRGDGGFGSTGVK